MAQRNLHRSAAAEPRRTEAYRPGIVRHLDTAAPHRWTGGADPVAIASAWLLGASVLVGALLGIAL